MNLYYIALLSAYLTLPGFALSKALRIKANALNSVALSYSIFVLTYIGVKQANMTLQHLSLLTLIIVSASAIICCAHLWRFNKNSGLNSSHYYLFGIIFSIFLYHLFVRAYSEVPADIYAHLERFQSIQARINQDLLIESTSWRSLLLHQSKVWYHLLAIASSQTGATTAAVIESTTAITSSAFLLAVFTFSLSVFKESANRYQIALATCCFVTLHMGINVFSFIRYYALAPTMLGFCLYFSAISLFLRCTTSLISTNESIKNVCLLALITAVAAANHTQEALFVCVMVLLVTVAQTLKIYHSSNAIHFKDSKNLRLWATLSAVGISLFFASYLYSHMNLDRAPNAHWRLWEFGPSWSIFPKISTLNLKFQFIQVMTLWGVFVYALFLFHWKRYKYNLFLLAGMLSPIFTILNPFFVDLFLRLDDSTTLWRLCYLIPIHFIAGDLLVHYVQKLWEKDLKIKLYSATVIALVFVLLLPISNTAKDLHFSRFPTLASSEVSISYTGYVDLISYLDALDTHYQVLTDPVTGYLISGLTKHHSERRKFFRNHKFKSFSYHDYSSLPLDKYRNHLLVVNQRKASNSRIGLLSKHWRKDEWKEIRHYYPPELLDHLESRPDFFKKIWSNDDISIYQIGSLRQ